VTYEDAEAFARWAGVFLPSEAHWEIAARGGLKVRVFGWGNTWNPHNANTWQGPFPAATLPRMAMAERPPSLLSQPTVRACSTCPATSGNGPRIGMPWAMGPSPLPILASVIFIYGAALLISGDRLAPFAIAGSTTLFLLSDIYRTWGQTLALIELSDQA